MAMGKPSPEELTLLEPFRDKLSAEVFGEAYLPPVSDGSGQDRNLLRHASQLLQEAGYTIVNGKRANAKGEHISIEFLLEEPTFQPHHAPFIKNLNILGIDGVIRVVDPVQFRARVDDFDFDITVERFSFSTTPGESLRSFFASQAAANKGSHNLAGISDPVVDALIEIIVEAKSRSALTVACRALDRVLRAGRYWIPHWYKPTHWVAYWDVFEHPPQKPRYGRGIPETWWAATAKQGQRG
jgi:microcin C transport system substrate-binding protein